MIVSVLPHLQARFARAKRFGSSPKLPLTSVNCLFRILSVPSGYVVNSETICSKSQVLSHFVQRRLLAQAGTDFELPGQTGRGNG